MDLKSIRLIREKYRDLLMTDAEYDKILFALSSKEESKPITQIQDTEPEADLSYNAEQRQLSEILLDMHGINNAIHEVKDRISEIIDETDGSLSAIRNSVSQQLEQVNDINMLCGNESNYNMIVPIYVSDFEDTSAEFLDAKTLGASLVGSDSINYDIVSVSGNGYSGNEFVYVDDEFAIDIDDRSKLEYIADANDITVYEYSRLCADKKQDISSSYINYDDRPAECTITLSAEEAVCKARITSPDKNLCIKRLETSEDGIRYADRLAEPLYINDLSKIYNHSTYIYGSNTLCFPYAKYVRITLSNNDVTNEEIRMKQKENIVIVNAKRKRIAIAGIELFSSIYTEALLLSKEILENGSIDKISLFATEYVPDHFTQDEYVQYALVINGNEYPIVPANSNKKGTVMIKCSDDEDVDIDQITIIREPIHTVRVKIIITPYNNTETPYVSNVKLFLGNTTVDLYV